MGIAEDWQLEKELRAGAQPKLVQEVNEPPMPSQPGDWIGIGVHQESPHLDVVRERLRARAKDEKSDPADREAARQALLVMYREKI